MNWLNKKKVTDTMQADAAPLGALQRSINFEVSREHASRLSERRAWIVAACSSLLALMLAVGYFFVMPIHGVTLSVG